MNTALHPLGISHEYTWRLCDSRIITSFSQNFRIEIEVMSDFSTTITLQFILPKKYDKDMRKTIIPPLLRIAFWSKMASFTFPSGQHVAVLTPDESVMLLELLLRFRNLLNLHCEQIFCGGIHIHHSPQPQHLQEPAVF